MEVTTIVLFVGLVVSVGLNLYQRFKPHKKDTSYDARALLHDLTAGAGLIKVTRIAPEDVILRSPRDMR